MIDIGKSQRKLTDVLLFLDFDGVCNSFAHGSYLTHKPDEYGVDEDIIARIREICGDCGARIIISSNWRRYGKNGYCIFNGEKYMNPLGTLMTHIGDLVDGTLPLDRPATKSEALELWFEDHPDFDGRYAIVDDDSREGFGKHPQFYEHWWLTNPETGIDEKTKNELKKHLSGTS